ncbi:hypothetical protein HYD75_02065 [Mycoplasmopsis bovis]|nr:hypothetical protein [Mycoplasmopsis bovis]QQH48918.1 hypothetical protein HYD75_02065 [Mycoplasmopsis bovis]
MVLVILLQILPHKFKIIIKPPQEDNIKEKEQSDDPKDLLEQLEKIRKDYEKSRKKKMKT